MNETTARQLLELLKQKGISVDRGLTHDEQLAIEQALGAKLPPDLAILLAEGVPVANAEGETKAFPQWTVNPAQAIADAQSQIEAAFEFDIKNSDYWHESLGQKPENLDEAVDQALTVIRQWPPLVRIYSHRFMPTDPHEPGNPVISVFQAGDTVYYGSNLLEYFAKEFGLDIAYTSSSPKPIPYWGDAFWS